MPRKAINKEYNPQKTKTHTYWMTVEEYVKHSQDHTKSLNTRKHIYFV